MSARWFLAALATIGFTTSEAHAAEYLTEVTSEVYQTDGTVREITLRTQTCRLSPK